MMELKRAEQGKGNKEQLAVMKKVGERARSARGDDLVSRVDDAARRCGLHIKTNCIMSAICVPPPLPKLREEQNTGKPIDIHADIRQRIVLQMRMNIHAYTNIYICAFLDIR